MSAKTPAARAFEAARYVLSPSPYRPVTQAQAARIARVSQRSWERWEAEGERIPDSNRWMLTGLLFMYGAPRPDADLFGAPPTWEALEAAAKEHRRRRQSR